MYPYNFQGNNQQNVSQHNHVNYPPTIYYGQQNQQGFAYQQPQFMNYPENVSVPVPVVPQSFQAMPNPRPIVSNVPVPSNHPEEKQKRYKLEQQRKFRNFQKVSKSTNMESMLSNIVPPMPHPAIHAPKPTKEPDDFGEFLQAPAKPNLPATSVKVPNNTYNGQTPGATVHHQSEQAQNAVGVEVQPKLIPSVQSKPGVSLQAKMMASLDLNQSHQASLKFKPISKQAPKRPEKKTFTPSNKAANWCALATVEDEFQEEAIPSDLVLTSALPPTPPPNLWLTDVATAPMVYKHIYEACSAPDGFMDTSRLYTILLQCNLPHDVLGQLWTLANQAVPGRLNQEELFILLALVALTQGGKSGLTVDYVKSLAAPPIPYLTAYANPPAPIDQNQAKVDTPSTAPSMKPINSVPNDDFDDFQDFQSNSNVVPELRQSNSAFQPIKAFPADFKTENRVSHFANAPELRSPITSQMQPVNFPDIKLRDIDSSIVQNADARSDSDPAVKSETIEKVSKPADSPIPIINELTKPLPASNLRSPQIFKKNFFVPVADNVTVPVTSSQLKPIDSQLSNKNETRCRKKSSSSPLELPKPLSNLGTETKVDKYAVFSSINDDDTGGLQMFQENSAVAAADSPVVPSILDYPNQPPPAYSSIRNSDQRVENVSFSDVLYTTSPSTWAPTMVSSALSISDSCTSIQSIAKSNSSKFDLFKTVISRSQAQYSSSPIPFDTVSVQSLEFSLSRAISQQSLGTIDQPTADIRSSPKCTKSPKQKYGPSFCDDDYDNLGIDVPPDMPSQDTFDDFDEFQEGNSTLVDFDAFSAFEPPPKSQTQRSPSPVEAKKRSQSPKSPRFPSPETIQTKRLSFENTEHVKAATTAWLSAPTPPPSPVDRRASSAASGVKSRHSSGVESIDFNVNDWNIGSTTVNDVDNYVENWEKCLTACCQVIANTNVVLSSINSPVICNEVVYSLKGQRFISDLSEVYGVAKRICASSIKMKIENETLQNLHKQIELSWHNLLAFCSNVPVIDHSVITSHGEGSCGVCLLALDGDTLSYAGREYHATCANFWVNRVDHVLPALQVNT